MAPSIADAVVAFSENNTSKTFSMPVELHLTASERVLLTYYAKES